MRQIRGQPAIESFIARRGFKIWVGSFSSTSPRYDNHDIANLSETYRRALVAWFASAGNGMHEVFGDHQCIHCVDAVGWKSCLGQNEVENLLKAKP